MYLSTNRSTNVNRLEVRHYCDADLDEVVELDKLCFEEPWTRHDYRIVSSQRNNWIYVVQVATGEIDWSAVVGIIVAEKDAGLVRVLRWAVHPLYRRLGIGRILMETVEAKAKRRSAALTLAVPDDLLSVHLALKALGFRAVRIEYGENGDMYWFVK